MKKTLSNKFHSKFIYNRRMSQLFNHLSTIIKKYNITDILDIGAGDGKIDSLLIDNNDIHISGIDVLVRDTTYITVTKYDGTHIDLDDNNINATMMIDVLHHTEDPSIIFNEAVRVTKNYIIIKDHIVSGFLSRLKLILMDYVGNKHYSVNLPYNYLSKDKWTDMFTNANVKVDYYITDLHLYKGLFHVLFDSNLHFIAVLKKDGC